MQSYSLLMPGIAFITLVLFPISSYAQETESCVQPGVEQETVDGLELLQHKSSYLMPDENRYPKCAAKYVIHLGLPRTGTFNMDCFMKSLGYQTHHGFTHAHMDINLVRELAAHGPSGKNFSSIWPGPRPGNDKPISLLAAPWAYFSCEVLAVKPWPDMDNNVKFTLVERNPTDWYSSVLTMFCTYKGHNKCDGSSTPSTDTDHEYFFFTDVLSSHICNTASKFSNMHDFCAAVAKDPVAVASTDQVGRKMAVDFVQHHNARVKSCVPSKDLVVIPLEADDDTKAKRIFQHLECSADNGAPPFPSIEMTGHEHC